MVKSKASMSASSYMGGEPKTGQRMVLSFNRNTWGTAAPAGIDVGQAIEPRGRYMNVSATVDLNDTTSLDGWVSGYIEFKNPLVMEHVSTSSSGWKKELSERYGGKTGRDLSEAVKTDGYDAIVTIDTDYGSRTGDWFNEVVDLGGVEVPKERFRKVR